MKFDKEFKKETELLSPSEEQTERIIKGVYERLEREKDQKPQFTEKPKKPLKIKIAALSGAAVCAAAVMIAVIGVNRGRFDLSPGMTAPGAANESLKTEGTTNFQGAVGGAPGNPDEVNAGLIGDKSENSISGAGAEMDSYESGYTGALSPAETHPSASVGSPNIHFSFSEDEMTVTVTVNGKIITYEKDKNDENFVLPEGDNTDLAPGFEIISDLGGLLPAENYSGENLIVQFDENELYVFCKSGEFFGHYTAK